MNVSLRESEFRELDMRNVVGHEGELMADGCRGNEGISQFQGVLPTSVLPKISPCQIRDRPIDRVRRQAEKQPFDLIVLRITGPCPDLGSRNHTHPERSIKRVKAQEGLLATTQEPDQHI